MPLASSVLPTPVGPGISMEPIGRFVYLLINALARRTAFATAFVTASS